MVGYLDPSSAAVGYSAAVAVNVALGGQPGQLRPGHPVLQGAQEERPHRPEADLLRAGALGRNPDPVRLRLQRLPRQVQGQGQRGVRHPGRGDARRPLRREPGQERAARGQRQEGARLHPVGQGAGGLGERLPAAGAGDRHEPGARGQVPARLRVRARQVRRLEEDGGRPGQVPRTLPERGAVEGAGFSVHGSRLSCSRWPVSPCARWTERVNGTTGQRKEERPETPFSWEGQWRTATTGCCSRCSPRRSWCSWRSSCCRSRGWRSNRPWAPPGSASTSPPSRRRATSRPSSTRSCSRPASPW
ncbi:MAG: hypothetical protein MZU91_07760 [Desulfosudis oleivorans]|nr:hypothetical protein [Desulfosudis oleivorans]